MTILLTPTHLDTIRQLIEIAHKHGCEIFISSGKCHYPYKDEAAKAVYEYCVESKGLPENLKEEFEDKIEASESYFLHEWICFELTERDPNGGFARTNHLTYSSYDMGLIGKDDRDLLDDGLSDEAEDWLLKHCPVYEPSSGPMIFFEETDTSIHGFEGTNTKVNVYREGMAVKFFGDLVCDYLHEPRIKKVY